MKEGVYLALKLRIVRTVTFFTNLSARSHSSYLNMHTCSEAEYVSLIALGYAPRGDSNEEKISTQSESNGQVLIQF